MPGAYSEFHFVDLKMIYVRRDFEAASTLALIQLTILAFRTTLFIQFAGCARIVRNSLKN